MDNVHGDRQRNQRQIFQGTGRLYIAHRPAMKTVIQSLLLNSLLFLYNQNLVTDSKNYKHVYLQPD